MNCIMQSISPTKAPKFKATQCFRHSLLTNPCFRLALRHSIFALLVVITSASNLAERLHMNQRRRLPAWGRSGKKNDLIKQIKETVNMYNLHYTGNYDESKKRLKTLLASVSFLKDLYTRDIFDTKAFLKEDHIKFLCTGFGEENRLQLAHYWANKLYREQHTRALQFIEHYCAILQNNNLNSECKRKYRRFLQRVSGYHDMVKVFEHNPIMNEDVETVPTPRKYARYYLKKADETQRNEFNETLQMWIQPRKIYFYTHYEPAKLKNLIGNLRTFLSDCGYEKSGKPCDYLLTAGLSTQLANWLHVRDTMQQFIREHDGCEFHQYFEEGASGLKSEERNQINAIVLQSELTFEEAVKKYTQEGGRGAHFFYRQIWDEMHN